MLRIEDTDAAREQTTLLSGLLHDLRWLGLDWDEGPDRGGPHAPYLQSERGAVYEATARRRCNAVGSVSVLLHAEELSSRARAQLAAGRPPRYAGTCAGSPTPTRSAAPRARVGPARFGSACPWDGISLRRPHPRTAAVCERRHRRFRVARADGSASFFLSNAVDDARMQVNLVLRGDDHLANTPRQLLLLEALELARPRTGTCRFCWRRQAGASLEARRCRGPA